MYLGRVHFYNHVLLVTIQKVKEKKNRNEYEWPRQGVFDLVEKMLYKVILLIMQGEM